MSSNLPSQLGSSSLALTREGRELARLGRATNREVATAYARAHVAAERGRANAQAVESVAVDGISAGARVAQHAAILAASSPVAEGMLREIVAQTGLAMGQIVSDTARDLR